MRCLGNPVSKMELRNSDLERYYDLGQF